MEPQSFQAPAILDLPCGRVVPLHTVIELGRRKESPILYYENGAIRSLPLQDRTNVRTRIGSLPAELLTFYPTGELKRVFPSAGKITGFWSEEQEYGEAPLCEICIGDAQLQVKIINAQFYRSGALKSLTLWPAERIALEHDDQFLEIRTGVSFYESGQLRSWEPAAPIPVMTPIGPISAYDTNPLGVSGDLNSVCYAPDGSLESLITMSTRISVMQPSGEEVSYTSTQVQSYCEEADTELRGLLVRFRDGMVILGDGEDECYPISTTPFRITERRFSLRRGCHG